MNKVVIYFPYPLRDANSGSSVRPLKMLKAFREFTNKNDLELIEIYGISKERKMKIKEFKSNTNPNDVLFCYMENSTLPVWLTDKDHLPRTPLLENDFLRYLKKSNIPIGLFYRDIYWKFDDIYPLKGYKRSIMRKIYQAELLLYKKYVTHFFLPSMEMNKYTNFPIERMSSLPPGGENLLEYQNNKQNNILNIIYVGAISESQGLTDMLQATEDIYRVNNNVKLHLVCREDEFKQYIEVFSNKSEKPWLIVYHAFGDQLQSIYNLADVAIIPRRKNIYHDFAVPVKLFEYISYGLPIISTNCDAQAKIIEKHELGIIVKDNVESLKESITYFQNVENRKHHSEKVKEALENSQLWIHRVEEISNKLQKKTTENFHNHKK